MIPLPTLEALDPSLPIAIVRIPIYLIAIVAEGLHIVESKAQITKLYLMVVRQIYLIMVLIWRFARCLVVRGAETIIALLIRLFLRLGRRHV